ncbi:MAG: hypothetical protein SVS15_02405 [Thermodesulfobacteriota bacterium]|nr:hypothetical protein [Thermodesulfobacteriota bacterium]
MSQRKEFLKKRYKIVNSDPFSVIQNCNFSVIFCPKNIFKQKIIVISSCYVFGLLLALFRPLTGQRSIFNYIKREGGNNVYTPVSRQAFSFTFVLSSRGIGDFCPGRESGLG